MTGFRRDVFADAANLFDAVTTGANGCVDLKRHVKVCIQHHFKRIHGANRRDGHVTKLYGVPTVHACAGGMGRRHTDVLFWRHSAGDGEPGSYFADAGDEFKASCIEISWQGWVADGVDGGVIHAFVIHHAVPFEDDLKRQRVD